LSFAWLGDAVPYERRQAVLAYFLSGQISGLVLGQTFAGIIAEHYGWRYVFVAMAAVFILAGIALFNEMRIHGTGAKAVPEDEEGPLVRLFAMVRQTWVMIVLVGGMFEGMIFLRSLYFRRVLSLGAVRSQPRPGWTDCRRIWRWRIDLFLDRRADASSPR
jgi:MFS transporter, YNFM family, putative membrane transport protein